MTSKSLESSPASALPEPATGAAARDRSAGAGQALTTAVSAPAERRAPGSDASDSGAPHGYADELSAVLIDGETLQAKIAELAAIVGVAGGARAVAGACAANPVAVAIPCHRVVRTGGALSGYRWGIERKRTLLEREQGQD